MRPMFIIFLYHFLIVIQALRWNSSGHSNNMDSVISLRNTGSDLRIDVHHQEIIIIKDIHFYGTPIVIYCFTGGYSETSDIEYSFCKEGSVVPQDVDCSGPYKDGKNYSQVTFQRMTISIGTKFGNRKGIKLTLTLPYDDKDSSGTFYFKATDTIEQLTIRSNNVQIRDNIYWRQNLVFNANNHRTIYDNKVTRMDLPITFPCIHTPLVWNPYRPAWILQEFPTPVSWSICPVLNDYETLVASNKATFSKCVEFTTTKWTNPDKRIRPLHISEMTKWKYYVNWKGELTIFDIDIESKPLFLSYSLMCYTKKFQRVQPINTYVKKYIDDNIVSGVIFDGTQVSYDKPLVPIAAVLQKTIIYRQKLPKLLRRSKHQRVAIYGEYSSSSNASGKWFYQGSRLHNGNTMIVNRFTVEFIGDIISEMHGNYTLVIHDNANTLAMTFMVVVLGSPILKDPGCLPQIRHVWEFDSISFICNYTDRPKLLNILINNEDFELYNAHKYKNTKLQKSYPYLAELRFNMSFTQYAVANAIAITYNAYQLRKSQGQTKYQDHTVTFLVRNNFGSSIRSSSIYTVPKVKDQVQEFPYLFNCTTQCLSSKTHSFRCRLNAKEYMNKELKVDHYWTINGHRLGQLAKTDNLFAPYFLVDPKTKDLTLLPISSNDTGRDSFVKKSLKSNFIICHIDIASSVKSLSSFNYMSVSDPNLKAVLRARIMLDFQPSKVAFISGITIASVALLLIIIGAVILYQRMYNVGETYPLEHLERKCGHDAAAELDEERIKSYHFEDGQLCFPSMETTGRFHKIDEEI